MSKLQVLQDFVEKHKRDAAKISFNEDWERFYPSMDTFTGIRLEASIWEGDHIQDTHTSPREANHFGVALTAKRSAVETHDVLVDFWNLDEADRACRELAQITGLPYSAPAYAETLHEQWEVDPSLILPGEPIPIFDSHGNEVGLVNALDAEGRSTADLQQAAELRAFKMAAAPEMARAIEGFVRGRNNLADEIWSVLVEHGHNRLADQLTTATNKMRAAGTLARAELTMEEFTTLRRFIDLYRDCPGAKIGVDGRWYDDNPVTAFDAVELNYVQTYADGTEEGGVEPHEADTFCVALHYKTGGIDTILDFKTEDEADNACKVLAQMTGLPYPVGVKNYEGPELNHEELLEAVAAIKEGDPIVDEVAAEFGQPLDAVSDRKWFVEAVAGAIRAEEMASRPR